MSAPDGPGGERRRTPRTPLIFDLEFRSAGSFLLAYANHLAAGGLFLEVNVPPITDPSVTLYLRVPGQAPIELSGQIAWGRDQAAGPGQPPGIAIDIRTPADQYGAAVDAMAFDFKGVRVLLGTAEPGPRAILSRYLRSIMSCEIIEVDYRMPPERLTAAIDLALVDLDSSGAYGDDLVQRLTSGSDTRAAPIIALAQLERDRVRAQQLGANEALANPPLFADFQACVVRSVTRPVRIQMK
jgi:CheY-like chemotaxis protein/Tfp pilus assembly protein PilZ